jgi:hypothetical protein
VDKRGEAGRRAEEQMAFYLREAFRRDETVKIFNDLSFDDDGIKHQIDHLVLHRRTLIIVESKSVTTEVAVNKRGEWTRLWYGRWNGMASPVEQAKRQAAALRQHLNHRSQQLSQSGKKDRLLDLPIAAFVAISDQGRWSSDGITSPLPVYKADLISDAIRAEIREHEKAGRLFARPNGTYGQFQLHDVTFARLEQHLQLHTGRSLAPAAAKETARVGVPLATENPPLSTGSAAPDQSNYTFGCTGCHGENGEAKPGVKGRHAYIRCLDCGKNNAAAKQCKYCGSTSYETSLLQATLYRRCLACGASVRTTPKRSSTARQVS